MYSTYLTHCIYYVKKPIKCTLYKALRSYHCVTHKMKVSERLDKSQCK